MDCGKEFVNKALKNWLTQPGTYCFVINNEVKVGVVERVNSTLKRKMWRYFTSHSTHWYRDMMQAFIQSYNRSYHSGRPTDVNSSNALAAWKTL